MGLPGAGKGTQAFKLIERFPNFVHFDTGAEIYRRINDPAYASDPVVQRQKKLYNEGLLNDPQWVADLIVERIRHYGAQGKGIVFSGSPRTLYEAQVLMPLLFEIYGEDRTLVILLSVREETARQRAFDRLVCSNSRCRYPTTRKHLGEPCPKCGRKLTDDRTTEGWKITKTDERFKEFRERTLPALAHLLSFGIAEVIDAEGTREDVFAKILEAIGRRLDTSNPKG